MSFSLAALSFAWPPGGLSIRHVSNVEAWKITNIRVSQNYGYLPGGPHNADCSTLGKSLTE